MTAEPTAELARPVGPVRVALDMAATGRSDATLKPHRGFRLGAGANALVMLNRVAFFDATSGKLDEKGQTAILKWAAHSNLGQDPALTERVAARRTHAVVQLRAQGQHVVRLRAEPQWRVAVGHGERANAHEIGLSLHGSYGWPVIRGSSLKGLAAAWAETDTGASADLLDRVFGVPRPCRSPRHGGDEGKPKAACGLVRFLDAVPTEPVKVVVDVLTPHVKPYYDDTTHRVPPADYHSPVPVQFLTVAAGAFAVDLAGPEANLVEQAADWLTAAGDELGAGAKTAAGYGYLTMSRAEPGTSPPGVTQ